MRRQRRIKLDAQSRKFGVNQRARTHGICTYLQQFVREIQGRLGVEQAGAMVEQVIAGIARGLVEMGVRQLVVAGGETSGACVQALGIEQMRIGAQIDPGVPWCFASSPVAAEGVHIALKSGNFGTPDFFTKAFARLTA